MSTKIVELNSTSILQGTDIYPVSQVVNNKRETVKVTVSQLYSYLVTHGIATTTQLEALSASLTVKINNLPRLPDNDDLNHDKIPVYDQNKKKWVAQKYNDYTLNYIATNYVSKSGSTMTGSLYLKGDPQTSNEASNKHYVDLQVGGVASSLVNYILNPTASKDGDILTYSSGKWISKKPNFVAQVYDTVVQDEFIKPEHINSIICFQGPVGGSDYTHTISIPSHTDDSAQSIDIGSQLMIMQKGTGSVFVKVQEPQVVTLLSAGNRTKLTQQNSSAFLIKLAANVWYLGGDIWQ